MPSDGPKSIKKHELSRLFFLLQVVIFMKPLCYQLFCKRLWQLQSPRFDFHKHTQVPNSKQIVHTHNGLISTSMYLSTSKQIADTHKKAISTITHKYLLQNKSYILIMGPIY